MAKAKTGRKRQSASARALHIAVAHHGAGRLDQAAAGAVLLLRHLVEHGRAAGELVAEAGGIGAVDARVVLLGRDREGEDLALAKVLEAAAVPELAENHG